jgi:hypothetical protein
MDSWSVKLKKKKNNNNSTTTTAGYTIPPIREYNNANFRIRRLAREHYIILLSRQTDDGVCTGRESEQESV